MRKNPICVIIVAAGSGVRFKSKTPKAFALLKGRPLIHHSLAIFEQIPAIHAIIVVGRKDYLGRFQSLRLRFPKIQEIVPGGRTRAGSVKCGLAALPTKAGIVLVHDAARPLISKSLVERLIAAVRRHKAAIVGVPVKATVKEVGRGQWVRRTPRRDHLWEAQTPQGFYTDLLRRAHRQAGPATDDAMLVERLGSKVKMVMGDYRNIKITTPEDLRLAKEI